MRVTTTVLAILVLAIVLVPGICAQDVGNEAGYSVTPAGNLYLPEVVTPLAAGTIIQGETDWYSTVVPSGRTSIVVDLNWGYSPNSLSLLVVAPDGSIGPFYDSSDGSTDGRIYLTISRTGGITPGTWKFSVNGDYVNGIQSYNFAAY